MSSAYDETLREALERTISVEKFSPDATRVAMERTLSDAAFEQTPQHYLKKTEPNPGEETGADESDTVTDFGDSSRIPPDLRDDLQVEGPRFEVLGKVGSGATSHVYAVRDNSLDRIIAVKYLRQSQSGRGAVKGRFIHEARITAKLEHPNILPVHDIGVSSDHRVFFAMKNVQGMTLGDAIRNAVAGADLPAEFATVDGRIRIMLKICDALAFAHDSGYIHQDVKPDNVMIGRYGEVLLLDWGSSLSTAEAAGPTGKALFGTPAYMSPEQARRERADERSDIYCIGATFFHALTLRHPTWATDPETFWTRKRRGEIDPASDDERRAARPALLDIALKAMHPDPAQRYQRVAEMANDLKRYQEGLAVSAHRETLLESAVRWYRRNRKVFWITSAAAALVLGAGGLLMREKIQELITWRRVLTEDFSQTDTRALSLQWRASRSTNWRDMTTDTIGDSSGPWWVEDGMLMGRGTVYLQDIAYATPIGGDLRVEWDAKTISGRMSLNCYIAGPTRTDAYTFHVGVGGNPQLLELTKGKPGVLLDRVRRTAALTTNQWHHFRMEKEGQTVRLEIDNELLFERLDPEVLSGPGHQQFGFENTLANTIAIDNIEVYHHPLPLKVSPLATPDQFLEAGLPREALRRYRSVMDAHAGHPVAADALYKIGRCLEELDSAAAALSVYDAFNGEYPNHRLTPFALYQKAKVLSELGRNEEEYRTLAVLARRFAGHHLLRPVFVMLAARKTRQMQERVDAAERSHDWDGVAEWLIEESGTLQRMMRDASMDPQQNGFLNEAIGYLGGFRVSMPFDSLSVLFRAMPTALADVLRERGAAELLLSRFPTAERAAADALVGVGAYERAVRDFPDKGAACARALLALGRYSELPRSYGEHREYCAEALLERGRYGDVLALYPDQPEACARALLYLNRADDVLERYSQRERQAVPAAAHAGKLTRYISRLSNRPSRLVRLIADTLHKADSAAQMLLATPEMFVPATYFVDLHLALRNAGRLHEVPATGVRRFPTTMATVYAGLGATDSLTDSLQRNRRALITRCLAFGEYDRILSAAPSFVSDCITALICQGRAELVRKRYPLHRTAHARLLLEQGRYEDVLSHYRDQRTQCAQALVALGRYDTVYASFPPPWEETYRAALALGKTAHVEQYRAAHRDVHAQHLYRHGRYDRVVDLYPDRTLWYGLSLVKLDRPYELPLTCADVILSRLERVDIAGSWAIREAERGTVRVRDSLLTTLPPAYSAPAEYHLRFVSYLLHPILQGLEGRRGAMIRSLDSCAARHPLIFAQQLRYEAAYLAARIDSSAFLHQPHRRYVRERLELLRAIRSDIEGDTVCARQAYLRAAAVPTYPQRQAPRPLFDSEALRDFMDWRLRALALRS